MTVVACPGSFDPITFGHLDVITRAARRFDEVVVAVVDNPNKQSTFTLDERLAMVSAEVAELSSVRVVSFRGLLVDLCRREGIDLVCKGVRGVADVEAELQMARMNLQIGDVDTVLLPANPVHAHLSSSLVREVARLGGPLDELVPERVAAALGARLGSAATG
ncbi:MAG: pantetheine-phosphate adenylyltransferase [Nitriliruptoraceae bacterium]